MPSSRSLVLSSARRAAAWCVRRGGLGIFLVAAFAAGWAIQRAGHAPDSPATRAASAAAASAQTPKATEWTCSMHPQIRQPNPGKCPICSMDLIPVSDAEAGPGADGVSLVVTEAAEALMNVRTAKVKHRYVSVDLRLVGKVEYDETRVAHITSRVPGRLDRLFVDYTGVRVDEGDHLVYLYSPELLTAQEELRRTAKAINALGPNSPDTLRNATQSTLESARRKLKLWGLTEEQIDRAEAEGVVSDHVTIYAPMGGTVVERSGRPGMYVETGTPIYTIADLSQVWVKLDAYESDLPWVHFGQDVVFTTEAYPGERFVGQVAFIDPVLNSRTRTVKVRVNVPNEDRKLKPGMFIRGSIRAEVATNGRVINRDFAGKWIGPMHPEIVKDEPGTCDICGMALVSAESLGYVSTTELDTAKPLVIPETAPLLTGTRAIVYVKKPGGAKPTYTAREIELGPKAGRWYIVDGGLQAGEEVVVNGNFKIDSALQIQAKPSMMNPPDETPAKPHDHQLSESARPLAEQTLAESMPHYTAVAAALADQDAITASAAAETLANTLSNTNIDSSSPGLRVHVTQLRAAAQAIADASNLEPQRNHFKTLSDGMKTLVHAVEPRQVGPIYIAHCPMADDGNGADWLQLAPEIRNPYMPPEMETCGTSELLEFTSGASEATHEH